jgi:erythromycin esterase-like protein
MDKFDLSRFSDLKNKRLIALGEMAHGSSGLHELGFKIFMSAVENLGSRVFGLEAPMGTMEQINSKLSSHNENPFIASDISQLYPVWRTSAIFKLFKWIYDFNHSSDRIGDEIHIFGFDVRLPVNELQEILSWARGRAFAPESYSILSEHDIDDLRKFEMMVFNGQPKEAEEFFRGVQECLALLKNQINAPERILFLLDRLHAWTKVYMVWARENKFEPAHVERDRQMHWLLTRQMKTAKSGPIVILAHLNHLLRNNLEVRNAKSHVTYGKLLGTALNEQMAQSLAVIGLFSANVELANATDGPSKFSAQAGSFEFELASELGEFGLMHVEDLPARLKGAVRIGDVKPKGSPLLSAYSDFEMIPARQLDYVAIIR